MDGLSGAASIIAVIQLSESVVRICGSYINAVKDAKNDIEHLQREVVNLTEVLGKLSDLINSPNGSKLSTSQNLSNDLTECFSKLTTIEKKIDPGKRGKAMSKLGVRALRWPLKRKEVEEATRGLERCKQSLNLALQVDQTTLITGMVQRTDLIDQKIDLARLPIATGAEFDSYIDEHEDECLPETRTELRRQIAEWAESPQGKCIFWLNGMAGTGKSTISRTVAKSFKSKGLLGATFFFKRGEGDRGSATRLFSTIVTQLMTCVPGLIPNVSKVIEDDPGIAGKALREQFDKLLFQPLLNLKQSNQQASIKVIVIDALDECDREADVRVILQQLPRVQELTSVRLQFFITSRPELPIRYGFKQIANEDHQDLVLHEIPRPVIEHDIDLFLKDRLARIRQERSLSPNWPGDDNIQTLVTMATPLFIFAATICRFVGDMRWNPEKRLAAILKDQAMSQVSKLDGTYLSILNQLLTGQDEDESEQLMREFREIIGVIIILRSPLSVSTLSRLLDIPKDDISNRLDSLHSVLSIPNDLDAPVRLLHLSFRDWLLDPKKKWKSPFWVDEIEVNRKIVVRCLAIMQGGLQKNICNLPGYGALRKDVNPQSISRHLSADLQYACRYWVHHLERSETHITEGDQVHSFLKEQFLYWLESMSILGIISECVGLINSLSCLVQAEADSEISTFLYDAKRFVLKNRQIADAAPLQLYLSGLVFAPEMSTIRRIFEHEIPDCICKLPKVQKSWGTELQTLEGNLEVVRSLAFSTPDGRLLASSGHGGVELWDATTGALQQTLMGPTTSSFSIIFSADGKLLASRTVSEVCLWDTTSGSLQRAIKPLDWVTCLAFSPDCEVLAGGGKEIYLWNTVTGALQRTWKGHLPETHSLAFSPDGSLLASGGKQDGTVNLWDPTTGALQGTLWDPSPGFIYVKFSPDSKLLVSGGHDDNTCKLWDMTTRTLKQTLEGHSDWIRSVDFTPDSKLIISGSGDKTIKIWDITTGTVRQTLEGHSSFVNSVACSPQGGLLASGGNFDRAIKLWDMTIKPPQETQDHTRDVCSIALSSDGKIVASSSRYLTVNLWDAVTGDLKQTLGSSTGPGQSQDGLSVVFSPDGKLVAAWAPADRGALGGRPGASNSRKIIEVWDTATGGLNVLEGHSDFVVLVGFSTNGRQIISGSHDQTIRIWDTNTGTLEKTLIDASGPIVSVELSSNRKLVASAATDSTVRIWDIATGSLEQTLDGSASDNASTKSHFNLPSVTRMAFSPGDKLFASSVTRLPNENSTIKLWDVATGALKHTLSVSDLLIREICFSKHSPLLVTDVGTYNIEPWYNDYVSNIPAGTVDIRLKDQWVVRQGEKVLWLPFESRPSCSAIENGTLALGHASGAPSIMEFSP